jgi:hypothetical protein
MSTLASSPVRTLRFLKSCMSKIFAWISFLLLGLFANASLAFAAADQYACGSYLFRGKLLPRTEEGSTLLLYPGSRKQRGILIRGIDATSELEFRNRPVEMNVYVYVPGEAPVARGKYIKKTLRSTQLSNSGLTDVKLLKRGPCKVSK